MELEKDLYLGYKHPITKKVNNSIELDVYLPIDIKDKVIVDITNTNGGEERISLFLDTLLEVVNLTRIEVLSNK